MDFTTIISRDDIFKRGITASLIINIHEKLTDHDREAIENNMGSIWIPYTYGQDSVNIDVLTMPFYNFLMTYGDQGDIQGTKKYCSHNIDILNRDYNVLIGEMFISRYGKKDPISKIIQMFIYDVSYYNIDRDDVIHYNTIRGERYRILPKVDDSIQLLSHYKPRRTILCNNGDVILKTGFCFFYNCVPIIYYDDNEDGIDIKDINGDMHTLIVNNGIIISGYENLPSQYRIRNNSIMDVYDIYKLLKLGMNGDDLVRVYGFDYKVVYFLETITSIVVWKAGTIVTYSNGHVNYDIDAENVIQQDELDPTNMSIDYDGKTIAFTYQGYINFEPIKYNKIMDINGYGILIDDENNTSIVGSTLTV